MRNRPAIITFSHLRWSFVYQRPQHLLTRIARQNPVYFIEEPVHDPGKAAHWVCSQPERNVTVLCPHTPCAAPGYCDEQMPDFRRLMKEFLATEGIEAHGAWFYTPMALPLLDLLNPQIVIYDCMDELSAFLNAPAELLEREEGLFRAADIVFTGGPSLYRAKKDCHPNVHCFPSSVDTEHFARGVAEMPEAPDQSTIPSPRLGYFGVIDERLDIGLIEALATAHPEWQIAMVGPVVKIDPEVLPKSSNIHYFGQRSYKDLPSYLTGWDVCLLPFARNQATRFISPTKTLEYMAAGKLIVSTPITDVADPYGNFVYLGATHAEFVHACESAISATPSERRARVNDGYRVIAKTSWDRTAASIQKLIEECIEKREAAFESTHLPSLPAGSAAASVAAPGLSAA